MRTRAHFLQNPAVCGYVGLDGVHAGARGLLARRLCVEAHGGVSGAATSEGPENAFYADEQSFAEFGLHEELVKRLAAAGFTRPSRVQAQVCGGARACVCKCPAVHDIDVMTCSCRVADSTQGHGR